MAIFQITTLILRISKIDKSPVSTRQVYSRLLFFQRKEAKESKLNWLKNIRIAIMSA